MRTLMLQRLEPTEQLERTEFILDITIMLCSTAQTLAGKPDRLKGRANDES